MGKDFIGAMATSHARFSFSSSYEAALLLAVLGVLDLVFPEAS